MLEEVKSILGNLFAEYGLTDDIIRLSQYVDKLIIGEVE